MIHRNIHLTILLPYGIFMEKTGVQSLVADTKNGLYGWRPNRLDGVAALVPGIFTFETAEEGTVYLAMDKGILVKVGPEVLVSVRNAFGGMELGKLHEAVQEEFLQVDEREREVRSVLVKLESGFIRQFQKLRRERDDFQ